MGKYLTNNHHTVPDLVITSTAKRASQTAELAMKAGNWNSDYRFSKDIYF